MKFGCSIGIFLNSANLTCRSTNISKCFSESLRLRDNENQLYSEKIKCRQLQFFLTLWVKFLEPVCNIFSKDWGNVSSYRNCPNIEWFVLTTKQCVRIADGIAESADLTRRFFWEYSDLGQHGFFEPFQ